MAAGRSFTFIRHGEAAHNPLITAGDKAAGRAILDPKLTALGTEQATALGAKLTESNQSFDIVVTSPLSRALQTTALACPAECAARRVVVTSLHTENGIPVEGDPVAGNPCQRGAPLAELRADYPTFDFAGCADEAQWTTDGRGGSFHPLGVAERLELFRTFLHGLPEDAAVLVVGHSGFWKKFLGQDQKMANCELVERAV